MVIADMAAHMLRCLTLVKVPSHSPPKNFSVPLHQRYQASALLKVCWRIEGGILWEGEG